MTKTQLVLADPPMETAPLQGPRETAELIITEPLATGHERGSQVAFVRISPTNDSGKPPFEATAKIFDPMCYPFETQEFPSHPDLYLSHNADREYSREVSALSYATQVGLAGGFVPKYYGSWTFNLDVPGSQLTRPVRLVLYEQIHGTNLHNLHRRYRKGNDHHFDAFHLPEKYRLEVYARLLDGQVKLLHKGLDQHDLAPRNVIVTPAPAENDPDPVVERVTLIDYADSIVFPLSTRKQHPHQKLALPINPVQYFRDGAGMQFDGWMADLYPGYEHWLREKFGCKEKAAEYAPVIEDTPSPEG